VTRPSILFAAASVLAIAAAPRAHAQASLTDLIQNGYFDQTTNGEGAYYTGGGTAPTGTTQATGWSACSTTACNTADGGYPFLFVVTPGISDGLHTGPTNGFADPWDDAGGAGKTATPTYRSLWGLGNGGVGPDGTTQTGAFDGNGPGSNTVHNFLIADGAYHPDAIGQTVNGLHVGDHYQLTFDWAAGQWYGNTGATTERFLVTFGNDSASTLTYNLPSKGFSGWMQATFDFTATAGSESLSFLGIGTPNGEPPMLLLDDVAMIDTPEPAALAMMAVGVVALGFTMRRRRAA
jgi:hypothetical protein